MQTTITTAWRRRLLSCCTAGCLLGAGGCIDGKQFRTVALPGIQTGVSSILNGVVDGVFAAIAVEPESDSSAG